MLWDEMVGDGKVLDSLNDYQLRVFGLACVRHAYARNRREFSRAIAIHKCRMVDRALVDAGLAIKEGTFAEPTIRGTIDALYSILPDEDNPDGMVLGWFDTIFALISLWQSMLPNRVRDEVRIAANGSLEAASREEMARITVEHNGLIGDEIEEARRNSTEYQAECEFQRGLLRNVQTDAGALLASLLVEERSCY